MKKQFIGFFTIILLLNACKRDSLPLANEDTGVIGFMRKALVAMQDSPVHGTIQLGAFRNSGGSSEVQYVLNGDIFSSSTSHIAANRIDVGQINFGNMSVSPDVTNSSAYYLPVTQTFATSNANNFGKVTAFSALGNTNYSIAAFDDSIYIPKIVELTGPYTTTAIGSHSKTTSMTVTWNSDGSNPNNAVVFLKYCGGLSSRADSTLPDTNYTKGYLVTDNGSYTIPSTEFSGFSAKSHVQVGVGRLNAGAKVAGGKRYHIIGFSLATALFTVTN